MCDFSPVRNWLIVTAAAIVAAIALIVVAAVVNGSWWLAWTSPGFMLLAAAAAGGAVLALGQAISALDAFCKCAGPKCAGPCSNMRNTLLGALKRAHVCGQP